MPYCEVCPDCGAKRGEDGWRRCTTCRRTARLQGYVVEGGIVEKLPSDVEIWVETPTEEMLKQVF